MKTFLQTLLVCFMFIAPSALAAEEKMVEKKVVYDLKTGDMEKAEKYLVSAIIRNVTYYQNHFEELHVIVVIHGDSYKFFQKGSKDMKMTELGKKLLSLHDSYNVSFEMCEVGMKKREIKKESLYPYVKIVQNATIALIDAQNDGYAYLPVH